MKNRGGRLLVLGGQKNQFNELQAIYQIAEAAGIGEIQAVMPDTLRRIVGETGFARFVPASNSGSLGKTALGQILHLAGDSDAIIIGANLTNNAETAMLVESLIRELDSRIIFTEEAFELLKFHPELITGNPKALVITTMGGLFALANNHHMPIATNPSSGVIGKMEILEQLASISKSQYLVFDGKVMVAAESEMSLTPLSASLGSLPAAAVGLAATFWVQHSSKPFTALTTAAYVLGKALNEETSTYTEIGEQIATVLRKHEQ